MTAKNVNVMYHVREGETSCYSLHPVSSEKNCHHPLSLIVTHIRWSYSFLITWQTSLVADSAVQVYKFIYDIKWKLFYEIIVALNRNFSINIYNWTIKQKCCLYRSCDGSLGNWEPLSHVAHNCCVWDRPVKTTPCHK